MIGAPRAAVTVPPGGPPLGGGGGGGPAGCSLSDSYPATTKGGAAFSHTYTFTNVLKVPITISSVTLSSQTPNDWSLDASQLQGVLQPDEVRHITVTFTPPAK